MAVKSRGDDERVQASVMQEYADSGRFLGIDTKRIDSYVQTLDKPDKVTWSSHYMQTKSATRLPPYTTYHTKTLPEEWSTC